MDSPDEELKEFVTSSNIDKINRRIRMDALKCLRHASSSAGGLPLSNPVVYKTVFQKRGMGILSKTELKCKRLPLYYFSQVSNDHFKKRSESSFSSKPSTLSSSVDMPGVAFVRAKDMISFNQTSCPSSRDSLVPNVSPKKKKVKGIKHHRNTILNYYSPTKKLTTPQGFGTNDKGMQNLEIEECTCDTGLFASDGSSTGISSSDSVINITSSSSSSYRSSSGSSSSSSHKASSDDCSSFKSSSSSSFGLLGDEIITILDDDSESDNESLQGPDYFSTLPLEIFETILCQIPILDLLLSLNRVSRYWYDVINNYQFLLWKKRYYRLKTGQTGDVLHFSALCESLNRKSINYCYETLFSFLKSYFKRLPSKDVVMQLRWHSKFQAAKEVLQERFPEHTDGDVPNPWCMIACLVLISETYSDISYIIKCLTASSSRCPVIDTLECLYCIASYLLYCKNQYNINHGLHYRVYYALYIFENQWSGTSDCLNAVKENSFGQQSILKYNSPSSIKLTHEQMRIVNHQLFPGHVVKIIAFAGTGKTSTLKEYARLRPSMRFLNIMYNKAVCDHASKCFPENVECRTSHSLAYRAVGIRYKHKLTPKIKTLDIIKFVKKDESMSITHYQYAWCVMLTVNNFLASADELITTAHVPSEIVKHANPGTTELSFSDKQFIARDAEKIWNKMQDIKDYDLRITHDGYLKLFQLMHPQLLSYDCIFVDEAQDCNAATLDFLINQSCPKIFVGDPHQQIYGFRGAVDALSSVPCTHTYYLTQSFRFGPEIAYIASCALEVMHGVSYKTLVGGTQPGSVTGQRQGQLAIIARSNLVLFNEAVRICCHKNLRSYEPDNVIGAFSGGLSFYTLDDLTDIYSLMMRQSGDHFSGEIKNRFIKMFKSFSDLQNFSKNTEDTELQGKIKLVLQHGQNIPEYVSTIKEKCKYKVDMANIVFTTAHKSKGLEFDTVCLTEDYYVGDFPFNFSDTERTLQMSGEFNILYVAITRAKKCLILSKSVYFVLLGAQERFEYPVFSEKVISEIGTNTMKCLNCEEMFKLNRKLVLSCRQMTLVEDVSLPSGYLCVNCSSCPCMNIPFLHPFRGRRVYEDITHRVGACLFGPLSDEAVAERLCPPHLDPLRFGNLKDYEKYFDSKRSKLRTRFFEPSHLL